MTSLEKRAWLTLWSLGPVYAVYFAVQIWFPTILPTMVERIACLSLAAGVHAVGYGVGFLALRRRQIHERPIDDERDRAIETRATRSAYFVLLVCMIVVGMVLPFSATGWQIVNAALLGIVLTELMRQVLIVVSYRGIRLAH